MSTTNEKPAAAVKAAIPLWRHFGWKGLVFPSVIVLALAAFGIARLTAAPDTETLALVAAQAAQAGAQQGAQQGPPTTEAPPPTTTPGYDYLSCSHQQAGDPTPCRPVLVWPLTEGAKTMIGFQRGAQVTGELNTANTRIVYDQIRNHLNGVDACQMWLGLERDASMNPVLTVYATQAEAPQGAAKLCDCSPVGATPGTLPTAGVS